MPRVYTQAFPFVGAVIQKDGKFLLVQEYAKGNLKTDDRKWSQPGGWPKGGEHPIDAVRREVKEETGLDFEPTALVGIYSLVRNDLTESHGATPHAYKFIFRGTIKGNESIDPEEIRALGWFTPDEIYTLERATLRHIDVKQEVRDFLTGRSFPLEIIRHTVS